MVMQWCNLTKYIYSITIVLEFNSKVLYLSISIFYYFKILLDYIYLVTLVISYFAGGMLP